MKLIKFLLNGKEINLTGDNAIIKSNNFNVDKFGNMTCSNATFNKGRVYLTSDEVTPSFKITSENSQYDFMDVNSSGVNIFTSNLSRCYFGLTSNNSSLDGSMIILTSSNGQYRSSLSEKELFVTTAWVDELKYYTLTQRSQEELKCKINKLNDNCIEIVKKSDIYKFNFKTDNNTHKPRYGFVIGEKYNTPNEVISENKDGIDLYSMTSILWKAIQEQQEQIEQLQTKIKEMEEK